MGLLLLRLYSEDHVVSRLSFSAPWAAENDINASLLTAAPVRAVTEM